MNKIILLLQKYELFILLMFLVIISTISALIFISSGDNMLYGDALSRMNISRKIIDNLTPGLAQLGNVWLPLPQLLMLPLISNNYLWHTGIAGAVVSMFAYVLGGIFIFKSAKILFDSHITPIFVLAIYAININLIYLQTTAMSEAIFICALSSAIYFFIHWIKHDEKMYLIPAAISIGAMTLIRYEALAVLLATIPMVFFYSWIKTRNHHKAESNTIIYTALAGLGFGIWSIYLWAIFGDPLYWKNYYTATHVVGDGKTQLHVFMQHISFIDAVWKYITAIVWMNGLFPTIIASLSIPILLYKSYRDRTYYFLPVLLSLSMFAFMILTLQRNTPIDQPVLNLAALLSPLTSDFDEFNIRYGLLMLPIIALLCGYLFNIRLILLKALLVVIISFQVYTYFNPIYSFIYQISISVSDNTTQGTIKEKAMVKWLKPRYQGGLIMISALKHDPQMLQMDINYKNYIHEGTGKYWIESTKDPQRYATWVIFDSYNKDDQVTKYLNKSKNLEIFYDLVSSNDGMLIYKIKSKPDIIVGSTINTI